MPKKGEETFKVEKLVDMRMEGKKKLFLVKWKGYPASQNTWEPVAHLGECKEMMAAFEKPEPKKRKKDEPEAPPAKKAKAAPAKEEPKKSVLFDIKEIGAMLMAAITGKKPPKPEKPEEPAKPVKEKKEPKKKPEAAVVEVDKIMAMRYRAKGGVQYQILWKDSTKSWEVADNVMDDDLIDEFEEAEQIKAYGGDEIKVGTDVEVKSLDEGFANSWAAAVVKKKTGAKFTVEYSEFTDDDGKGLTESGLARARLRIAPGAAPKGWTPVVGEIIELSEDDCWWEASVKEVLPKNKFSVMIRTSDEIKTITLSKKLRPCSWLKMA